MKSWKTLECFSGRSISWLLLKNNDFIRGVYNLCNNQKCIHFQILAAIDNNFDRKFLRTINLGEIIMTKSYLKNVIICYDFEISVVDMTSALALSSLLFTVFLIMVIYHRKCMLLHLEFSSSDIWKGKITLSF